MKNLKKLSRQELKTVTGATKTGGPFPAVCIAGLVWCEKIKRCIPAGSNCNDFEVVTPEL